MYHGSGFKLKLILKNVTITAEDLLVCGILHGLKGTEYGTAANQGNHIIVKTIPRSLHWHDLKRAFEADIMGRAAS